MFNLNSIFLFVCLYTRSIFFYSVELYVHQLNILGFFKLLNINLWISSKACMLFVKWSLNKLSVSAHFNLLDALTTSLPSINLKDFLHCLSSAVLYIKDYAQREYVKFFCNAALYASFVHTFISLSSWFLQGNPLFNWTVIAGKYLRHLFDGGWRCLMGYEEVQIQRMKAWYSWENPGNLFKLAN